MSGTLTAALNNTDSALYRIDLSSGKLRLGGSILAQTLNQLGCDCPDLERPEDLANFFAFIQAAAKAGVIQAYHDIGDGGLIASVAEMQFASRMAITLALSDENLLGQLFAEELGAVVQVLPDDVPAFVDLAKTHGVSEFVSLIGQAKTTPAGGAGLDVLSITTPKSDIVFYS